MITPQEVHEHMQSIDMYSATLISNNLKDVYQYIRLTDDEFQFGKQGDILTNYQANA